MIPRSSLLFLGLAITAVPRATAVTVECNVDNDSTANVACTPPVVLHLEQGSDNMNQDMLDGLSNETTSAQVQQEEEEYDQMFDELYFGLDLGVPQTLYDAFEEAQVEHIKAARAYMEREVWLDGIDNANMSDCRNVKEDCSYYAVTGECDRNVEFMRNYCAPMCEMCNIHTGVPTPSDLDPECPVDRSSNAIRPGDLDKIFERIMANPDFQLYEPTVLSRPTLAEGDTTETADYIVGGPWMILFDNITTAEEADRLVELGAVEGYERSRDVSDITSDGPIEASVSPTRTSTNAWCLDECAEDPLARAVVDRMATLTGIPEENAENLQLLRYEQNQFYSVHHDFIPQQKDRPVGARILTFYIYLNDVEEGGGTNFPHVDPNNKDFAITPKKGRAVLWPSVFSMAPETQDDRTLHQALPVTRGVKYGANAWIHMRDFKNNNAKGCA